MSHSSGSKLDSRSDSGVKVICGFEMLISDSQHQDKAAVREMKMLLDDLDTGDESLPSDSDIAKWSKQEDDEKWLDIDFNDLEKELGGKNGKSTSEEKREFGDKAAQENLQRIVKQFEDFLGDDKAGPDGAGFFDEASDDEDDDDDDLDDLDEDDEVGEDKDASFDEDEFSKMMQEMMGMPSDVMREIMKGNLAPDAQASQPLSKHTPSGSRVQDLDDDSSEEGEADMEKAMAQMEEELRGHGALNLEPATRKVGESKRAVQGDDDQSGSSEDEDGGENDIDVKLVKNLLESFKAQSGMAGPGGNMMGLMGMNMPRDEADDPDAAGPSTSKSKR